MKSWSKILLATGVALVLAGVAAGATVYALRGDSDGTQKSAGNEAGRQAAPGDGSDVASICLEGAEDCGDTAGSGGGVGLGMCAPDVAPGDCVDMVVDPSGATCPVDNPDCGDRGIGGDAACPPDMACVEPWLMDPPSCPAGVAYGECFPDGPPRGYECVTLESDPVQVRCYAVTCEPVPLPPVSEDELKRREESGEPAAEPTPCIPPTEPCDDTARCLPPDCAVSSDGSIACPDGGGPADCVPGPAVDCIAPEPGQAEPGSSGGGTDPVLVDPPANQ
jgi:hypothetical protein